LYESAGEAGGAVVGGRRGGGRPYTKPDPERSAVEAARRARGKLRRYCTANRLNRFGSLTYAGEGNHDPMLIRLHLGEFFRSLRSELGCGPFPYVWVPEWHKTDHGLHAHFAVGRFIPRSAILAAWPHGFVHIKLIGDLPVGSGPRAEARRAAGYLSKYVGKSFEDERRIVGLHRYEVAQGFQPQAVRITGEHLGDVLGQASQRMGARPSYVWQSQVEDGWNRPPAVWASWD
jgi:hypothetical protein